MKNSISEISIPVTTLNAIKGLLFSNDGVDLTSIADDLAVGQLNRDLVSINVGLTFKGIKPEIDKTTRYSREYRDLVEYKFVSYSLIRDLVTIEKKVIARWDTNKNDLCPIDNEPYVDTITLHSWYDKETDRSIPTQELVKQWAKKDEE